MAAFTIDFSTFAVGTYPNPWDVLTIRNSSMDYGRVLSPTNEIQQPPMGKGLSFSQILVIEMKLKITAASLDLCMTDPVGNPVTVKALDAGGAVIDQYTTTQAKETVIFQDDRIASFDLEVIKGSEECILERLTYEA